MNSILKRLRRVAPASLALCALVLSIVPMASTQAAVANTLSFQGRLLTGPTTPAASTTFDMRFSLWAGADFVDGTDRVSGALVGAPWQEVQTLTTDAQGFFITNVGSVTALPSVFDSNVHKFLQAEVKVQGAANTSYFLLDNMAANSTIDRKSISNSVYAQNAARLDGRKLGFSAGDIPYLDPTTGKLDRNLMTDDSWLDPVADETALNALTASSGDVVFVQSTARIYTYDGAAWIKTGGAIDGSISAIEGRMTTAEADIDANTAAITAEAARAAAAEAVLTSDLSTEAARAAAAEAILTSGLTDENTRALAAETALNSAITSEATRALAAEAVLTSAVADEETRAIAAEIALNSAITSEATRALAAEAALDTRMTSTEANTASNLAAIQSNDGELSTLNSDVNTAGSVLKSINDNATNAGFSSASGLSSSTLGTAIDEVNTNLSNAIQGLTWKSPVTNVADLTTTYPTPTTGDTAYVTSTGEIHTYNGSAWVKTGADFFQDGDESNKGIVQFATNGEISALKAVQSNDGRLAQVGINTTNITTNAVNVTTNGSNISANATAISTENTRAAAAEAGIVADLNTEEARALAAEAANASAITAENTRATNAEAGIISDLNAEEARAVAAETALTNALNTESARALAAELVNSNAISTEEVRALAAEAVNAAAVVTEKDRAEAVETALQSALDAEIARATAAEAANAADIADHRDFNSTDFDVFILDFN